MAQKNNQSVRNEAESALTTNRIPTFEEVYAMPYVQKSIRAILEQNVRQYPLLATYQDDLRQEMLIKLFEALPQYDGRAGIEAFCRICLENGFKNARRQFFQTRNLRLAYAKSIDDFESMDDEDSTKLNAADIRAYASMCHDDVSEGIKKQDIMIVIGQLPDHLKVIANRILKGESIRSIEREMGIPHTTFRRKYLIQIRLHLAQENF